MSSNFQKKTSQIFVTVFIGFIVISFIFTGFDTFRGTKDTIAKVGSLPIKAREYQLEYDRQLNFYKRIFGGKDLSSQQIESMGVRRNALNNLVTRKLSLILADQIGVNASPTQIKDVIKKLPYFQQDGAFSLNLYKRLLAANRLNPQEFEEDMSNQVKSEELQKLFANFPVSDNYIKDIKRFKEMRANADIIQFDKSILRKHIKVSKKEIREALKKDSFEARVKNLFKERKPSLDIPEKVKASHILIKATPANEVAANEKILKIAKELSPKNFKKKANKYTEDPSGKGQGGSLGVFSRGRMVPAFEDVAFTLKPGTISKPIKTNFGYHIIFVEEKIAAKIAKFEKHSNSIAKELIQGEKNEEFDKMGKKMTGDLERHLSRKNYKQIEKLQNQYSFKFEKSQAINRFDGSTGAATLDKDQLKEVFSNIDATNKTLKFESPAKSTLVLLTTYQPKKDEKPFSIKEERKGIQVALTNKVRDAVIDSLKENHKVVTYGNLQL
jgi:peptidyl-prolyl cis-trans isomerase D